MTSPTSESYEEEMLKRARKLAETRGRRQDKGLHDWFLSCYVGRLYVEIREADDQVLVSLRNRGSAPSGTWAVYYPELDFPAHSIYKPEFYQECVELMREAMILDDLADV